MHYQLQSSQIRGLNDELHWSQTFAEGSVIITMELQSDGSFSAREQGEKVTNELAFLIKKWQPHDPHTLDRLITQYIDASFIRNKIISLVAGYLTENKLHLLSKMGGAVYLKRGSQWSQLLQGEGIVSGTVEDNDIVICQTVTFQKLIPENMVFHRFTTQVDPLRAGESLGATLHSLDQSKGAAAVFAIITSAPAPQSSTIESLPLIPLSSPVAPDVLLSSPQPIVPVQTPVPNIPNTDNATQDIIGAPKKSPWTSVLLFLQKVKTKIPFKLPQLSTLFSSPRRRVLVIAVLLVLILIVSTAFNLGSTTKTSTLNEVNLTDVKLKIEEGEGLVDLNNIRARTLLTQAKETLSPLVSQYKTGSKERLEIQDLLSRIDQALLRATKATRVDSPPTFIDLTIVKAGALAQHLALFESQMAVLDTQNPTVILIDSKTQSPKIAGGGANLSSPRLIALYSSSVFTLSHGKEIIKIDTKTAKQTTAVKDLSGVSQVQDMVAFAGNLYLLDTSGNIWKISAAEGGYSGPKPYLIGNPLTGSPASMAIDGSIWVLADNGVKKFTKGQEEEFTLSGFGNPPDQLVQIYTDSETKNIYLLDKGGGKVLVFDKNGLYQSQYLSNIIPAVSDIVVSEANKKIYLLSANLIYEIALQ